MIYYFSGTGNSRYVAESIAKLTGDSAISITDSSSHGQFSQTESMGFVFPVYAWGLPRVMERLIRNLQLPTAPSYIYMVCTCGDDIGLTDEELRHLLTDKNWHLDAAWSVQMPNTYIALPGFDIDSPTLTQEKLSSATTRIGAIARLITERVSSYKDVCPGGIPWIKSKIFRPVFNRLLTHDRKFKSNTQCTHCGICAKVCPMNNIRYDEQGFPRWHHHCADCLACYHSCPHHAIEYGSFTRHKGQYLLKKFIKN